MSDLTVARRYAQALHEEAGSKGSVEATDLDIAQIRQALEGSPELVRFFESPVISRDKKKSVVEALFADRLGPQVLKLVQLLVDKRREQQLMAVVDAYQAIRDQEEGVVGVSVRCARALTEDDRKAISASLQQRLAKRIRLEEIVDTSLIGGIVVKVGDTVYDGSVSNRLASLRERLMGGAAMN